MTNSNCVYCKLKTQQIILVQATFWENLMFKIIFQIQFFFTFSYFVGAEKHQKLLQSDSLTCSIFEILSV